jgi:lipoprotein-releasing system permease protein
MSAQTFELFVAARYLRAKRKQAVISVITVISIVGVAAGVMALVIGLAINNGFRTTLQQSLLGTTAHVMLLNRQAAQGIANWKDLEPALRKLPHVTSVSPGLYGKVLLTGPLGGAQADGAVLKGVPLDMPPDMLRHLKQGSFDELKNDTGLPGIILGARLAQNTGMLLHSVVNVISPQGTITPFGPHLSRYQFRVVGIVESGFYDVDSSMAFTALHETQIVFDTGDVVSDIELQLDDIYKAPEVAQAAEKAAGPPLVANTWMEQYRQILTALNMEKIVTAITIGLIQLVAALNILITLIMMVMEKTKDIAVLMSMGTRRRQVRNVFIGQGVLIGVIGTVIGIIAGYAIAYAGGRYHVISLSPEVYSINYVPFAPRLADGIWIAVFTLLVSFVATLYPSWSASRILPAEALRYE